MRSAFPKKIQACKVPSNYCSVEQLMLLITIRNIRFSESYLSNPVQILTAVNKAIQILSALPLRFLNQARESTLVPEGFLKAQFLRKLQINGVSLLCLLGERKSVDKSILPPYKLLYTFPFLQESNTKQPYPSSPIATKAL